MNFQPLPGLSASLCLVLFALASFPGSQAVAQEPVSAKPIRVGIIGLDTSHAPAFARLINAEDAPAPLNKFQVVAAYPQGSPDIESSVSRVPRYTQELKDMGIEIVDSIESLLSRVDAVLLETNDGRPHLEQVVPVLKANKPVFVDKPVAGSLVDALAIFAAADHYGTPLFSSSSLRFAKPALQARQGDLVGEVLGCCTFSPCKLESTHPDLYWYGIHGVEQLFTVMGPGCQSVTRVHAKDTDVVVGVWNDGRIGSFRGTRSGPHSYGGTVFGTKGQKSTGGNEGYQALVVEICRFFQTGKAPVESIETLEIYAFMSAADLSQQRNGASVSMTEVMNEAKAKVGARLAEVGVRLDRSDAEDRSGR